MYSDESDRLARLERMVGFLFQRLGIDPDDALVPDDGFDASPGNYSPGSYLPPAFHDALNRGKNIEAIKIYRTVTGASLKDAKDAVDAMARGLGR